MSRLIEQIKQKDACAFTHGGKFHADDVFSSALLLYIHTAFFNIFFNEFKILF